ECSYSVRDNSRWLPCASRRLVMHIEKCTRAAGLLATADRVISTNLELSKASLQTTSEIDRVHESC
uniref:Uncharacterized protein n=1 Tax=Triticum urartu TaxID=4572 RepID=A0A8R7P9J7_TRIUA